MAQKLAPVEKNSTDISAASAAFCISASWWLAAGWMPKMRTETIKSVLPTPSSGGLLLQKRFLIHMPFNHNIKSEQISKNGNLQRNVVVTGSDPPTFVSPSCVLICSTWPLSNIASPRFFVRQSIKVLAGECLHSFFLSLSYSLGLLPPFYQDIVRPRIQDCVYFF